MLLVTKGIKIIIIFSFPKKTLNETDHFLLLMLNPLYFYHEACFSFWSNNCRMALAVALDKN